MLWTMPQMVLDAAKDSERAKRDLEAIQRSEIYERQSESLREHNSAKRRSENAGKAGRTAARKMTKAQRIERARRGALACAAKRRQELK